MKLPLFALAAAVALGVSAPVAQAQDTGAPAQQQTQKTVMAELVILHATNDGSGIDPKIGKMPELGKPPFSSFNSYKLVEKKTIQLTRGKASQVTLPTNSTLSITFKDVVITKPKDATQKPETPRPCARHATSGLLVWNTLSRSVRSRASGEAPPNASVGASFVNAAELPEHVRSAVRGTEHLERLELRCGRHWDR